MSGLVDTGQQGNPFIFRQPDPPNSGGISLGGAISFIQDERSGVPQVLKKFGIDVKTPGQHQKEREAAADDYYNRAIQGDKTALDKLYGQSGLANPGQFGGKNCPQNPGGVCYGAATSKARSYFEERYNQAVEVLKSSGERSQGNPNTLGSDPMNVAPGNLFSGFGFPKDFGKATEAATGVPLSMLLVLGAGLLLLKKGLKQ